MRQREKQQLLAQIEALSQRKRKHTVDNLDPVSWAKQALHIDLDPWQINAMTSQSKRIAVLAGRRTGKSFFSGILSLYEALHYPNWQVIILSPSLAQSGELLRVIRSLYVTSGSGVDLVAASASRLSFSNGSRVICLPGTEQSSRGYYASRIVFDEASRIPDQSFYSAMPLLANTQGSIVAISTPWTLSGFFYNEWSSGSPVWERYSVKAEECPRISADFLAEQRAMLPPSVYECEYECVFRPMGGLCFNQEDIEAAFT